MNIAIFKIVEFILVFIFGIFISDWRKKKEMVPLLPLKLIIFIKILYIMPILFYLYILITMESLIIYDFIGLFFNIFGVFLVAKAKMDLGKYHTWAGYRMTKTKLIKEGIYSFMRHPLYTGIILFILGSIIIVIGHGNMLLISILIMFLAVLIPFIIYSAIKETRMLEKEFNKKFLEYKKRVGPFFSYSLPKLINLFRINRL